MNKSLVMWKIHSSYSQHFYTCWWIVAYCYSLLLLMSNISKSHPLLLWFIRSVVSDSSWPCELQNVRLPCPSPSPGICSNSCPLCRWCHPTISSSATPFSSCPQSSPASVFSNESALHIRWPKYWRFSFSISLFKEYSGLVSFRIDCFDLLAVQGTLKSLLQHHNLKSSIPGEENGNPLQYSCLEKSMDRGAWQAAIHGVTWLSMCARGWREMGW